jgi:hypothetical protein
MRLAFFCGSLEFGRDGVGDYSRRLAVECIRQGHQCVLAALNDPCLREIRIETQELEGAQIQALRLPSVVPWEERIVEAREWLAAFNPDRTSLQFVPFGFHRKGLCFGLGKKLTAINPNPPWDIMFHELWLGLGEGSPMKDRVIGAMQRSIILDMLGRLRPAVIHTQAEPYQEALGRVNVQASILPLFSNIPNIHEEGWNDLIEPLVNDAAGESQDRNKLFLAGVLGGVHPEWNADEAVNTLLPLAQRFQKRLVLVFHGKNNLPSSAFSEMKSRLRNRALVVVTGEKTPAEISRILNTLDLGVATSPRRIIQKSGSVAAMLEHGLHVLVTRDDWRLNGTKSPADEVPSRLLSPKHFDMLETLPARGLPPPEEISVHRVAESLLAAMKSPMPAATPSLSPG